MAGDVMAAGVSVTLKLALVGKAMMVLVAGSAVVFCAPVAGVKAGAAAAVGEEALTEGLAEVGSGAAI